MEVSFAPKLRNIICDATKHVSTEAKPVELRKANKAVGDNGGKKLHSEYGGTDLQQQSQTMMPRCIT